MATGSLSGGVCFDSSGSAYDAYFSALPTTSVIDSATGVLTQTSLVNIAGVWNLQQTSTSLSGNTTVVYSVPAFLPALPACYSPNEAFVDGVSIGWALAAVLVIVVFVQYGKELIHA